MVLRHQSPYKYGARRLVPLQPCEYGRPRWGFVRPAVGHRSCPAQGVTLQRASSVRIASGVPVTLQEESHSVTRNPETVLPALQPSAPPSVVVYPASADAQLIAECVAALGHGAVVAHPGEHLEALLRRTTPNLLFLGDGMLASAELIDRYPTTAVVLFGNGARLDRETLIGATQAGISDVLTSPFTERSVGAVLDRQSRRRLARQTRAEAYLREIEQDQRAGRYIQMGMLPPSPSTIGAYEFRHAVRPSLMLSGDFVDYFRLSDRTVVTYMADVSGHGASSAFVTVLLKQFCYRLRKEGARSVAEPADLLRRLNTELFEHAIDKHIAMWVGLLDLETHRLLHANAGHFPQPIHVRDGSAHFLELTGRPLGLFPEVSYRQAELTLMPDDRLLVASDGVLEMLGSVPLEQKEQLLLTQAAAPFDEVGSFWEALGIGTEAAPDDISTLVVQRRTA